MYRGGAALFAAEQDLAVLHEPFSNAAQGFFVIGGLRGTSKRDVFELILTLARNTPVFF